jgi:putative ABC transport system permease protein
MPHARDHIPPALLRRFIRAILPKIDRDLMVEELDALFRDKASTRSRVAANVWYARQAAAFFVELGLERIREAVATIGGSGADARIALRSFRRHPGFAVSFVVTLAIATGVLSTVYTAAHWVLLRPVPGVSRPEELVTIRLGSAQAPPHVSFAISQPDYETFRNRLPVNGNLAALTPVEVDARPEGGDPFRLAGALVSHNYFSVLGVRLSAGRGFLAGEETASAGELVAVISQSLALRLNSSGSAVGMRVRVNGASVLVVGVAPAGFRGAALPGGEEIWLPASALSIVDPSTDPRALSRRGEGLWRRFVGRLPAGTTTVAITAAANNVMENIRAEFRAHSFPPTHFVMQGFDGIGLDPSVRATVRRTLGQLGVVATLLLFLAIANLSNLALIESTKRATNAAVRIAIGATRARLARAALVETALLGIVGTMTALWLAYVWSAWYQGTRLSEYGGALTGMHVGPRIAVLTMVVAFVAAGIAFLRPSSAVYSSSAERLMRRSAGDVRANHRLRSALIAVQVALSLVLLTAAGLLGRTVLNLRSIDLGFDPNRLLTFSLDPHLHGYESSALDQLARRLETRLGEAGGFRGAGFVSPAPLRSSYVTTALYGSDDPEARPLIGAGFFVTPGFLPAVGAHTVAGDAAWQADSGTIVITRGALKKLFPGMSPSDAIGRSVPTRAKRGNPVRIAAVIEDVSLSDITNEPVPAVFHPLAQRWPGMSFTAFVDGERASRSAELIVRRVMSSEAPELPLFDVRSARAAVDEQFADRNAMARAAATLAAIGLILAAVGLYAVVSAAVATRRREIGVRTALGATPRRTLRRVLVGGLIPVAVGLPFGMVGSVLISRLLAPQLFGLEAIDPLAYAVGVVALLLAAVVAALLPAWRATRISPAEVLRED